MWFTLKVKVNIMLSVLNINQSFDNTITSIEMKNVKILILYNVITYMY